MADRTEPENLNNTLPAVPSTCPSQDHVSGQSSHLTSTPRHAHSPISPHINQGLQTFSRERSRYSDGYQFPNGLNLHGEYNSAEQTLGAKSQSHEVPRHDIDLGASRETSRIESDKKFQSSQRLRTGSPASFHLDEQYGSPYMYGDRGQGQGFTGRFSHRSWEPDLPYRDQPYGDYPYYNRDSHTANDVVRRRMEKRKRSMCDDGQEPLHNEEEKNKSKDIGEKKTKDKNEKEKKSITTKTFAHGMMDVSLMTSNASQLRSVMANPDQEFYTLLLCLLAASVALQILSGVILIMSDFYKTQVKEKDLQNGRKRKFLNFLALAMVMVITSLNVLISAFYTPGGGGMMRHREGNVPQFVSADYHGATNHTEL